MTAPDLGPNTRALLEAARGAGPDAAAIARMRGKIDAAIAAPIASTPASSTASAVPAPITTGLTSTAKLGLLALTIVGVVGVGLVVGTREAATDRIASLVTVDPPSRTLRTVHESTPAVAVETPQAISPSRVAPPPKPSKSGVCDLPGACGGQGAGVDDLEGFARRRLAHASEPVGLAREVELVDRAMSALRSGNARNALLAVRLHASETRDRGQLAEDAAAIEVEALCTLHDPASAKRLAAFDARWPASAQRTRLTKTCR